MRTANCTIQQSLTSEALSLVKQAVVLAKRRGHAQVTPLHVASTMLGPATGLLRTACLHSHSHPLQCKALELCFNVALNRLPATNSNPTLASLQSQQHHPSISNALVAAFKRAQAHQRRGSIESQQQLCVKIEAEQLVISILDDPSVSRVMREAGFSSTQVKSKVEQEMCKFSNNNNNDNNILGTVVEKPGKLSSEEDVVAVRNELARKRGRRDQTLLSIHPLTISPTSLSLTVMANSEIQSQCFDEKLQLSCCGECSAKFETELAKSLQYSKSTQSTNSSTPLPAWLQQYKNENKAMGQNDQKWELYKKWNSICNSIHKNSNNNYTIISSYKNSHEFPNSSSTISNNDHFHNNNNEFNFLQQSPKKRLKDHDHHHNNNEDDGSTTTNSTLSGSDIVTEGEYVSRFKELNLENFKKLCDALEKKVPWQKNVVGDIVSAVLQCRSGIGRRKGKMEQTWLLFRGNDQVAKKKVATELAKTIFGSKTSNFVTIKMSSISTTRTDSTEDYTKNKRTRDDEQSCNYIDRFSEEVSINPHRVFLVEDFEQADYRSRISFKRAIEGGMIASSDGRQVGLDDAIVVLSCESSSAWSRAGSPRSTKNDEEEESRSCLDLDLNISTDDYRDVYQSIDDVGVLDLVDRPILFQIPEL